MLFAEALGVEATTNSRDLGDELAGRKSGTLPIGQYRVRIERISSSKLNDELAQEN